MFVHDLLLLGAILSFVFAGGLVMALLISQGDK